MIYKQSAICLSCTVFLGELAFCGFELSSRKISTRVREQRALTEAVFLTVSIPVAYRMQSCLESACMPAVCSQA